MIALCMTDRGPEARDVDLPDLPPTEACVDLSLGGVCATDLEIVRGYMGFVGTLGHEWVGTVAACADPSLVGRRVVGDINCPCGVCPTCRAGRPTHCPTRTVLGIVGRDGAFSQQFHLPIANLHLVPDAVSDEAAVFVEPLAAACQILEQVHVRPSHRVVVIGAGRLGQLCARVLARTGADVRVLGRSTRRLDPLPASLPRTTDPADLPAADVVVDCSGAADGLALAGRLVRPRGTIVLKTTVHDAAPPSPNPWVIDEVTVVGSRCGPFAPALRLLASGEVDPTPLVTGRYPLARGVEALAAAARPEHIKVVLTP